MATATLVPRWRLTRAASIVPLLIMLAALAILAVIFSGRPHRGDEISDLIVAVVTMIGLASMVASFAAGLLAGGLRLRYLARK